ncbi:uncharacterized protein LOC144179480 [Haemaphysalis longicornis]
MGPRTCGDPMPRFPPPPPAAEKKKQHEMFHARGLHAPAILPWDDANSSGIFLFLLRHSRHRGRRKCPPKCPATSSATELTPVHERTSRRLQGLPVEFQPMTSRPRMATRDASTVTSGTGTAPSYFVVHQPRTPKVFYGDSFEDGEDWLDQFERVANFNGWNEQHKLHNVYYALEESARTWFENHEATLTPWNEFRRRFLATYACTDRREKAESALQARNQRPNENVTMYVEDMARLFRRADPAMSEEKKLRHLMRGVKQDVFAGLVRNPPQSVSAFLSEATAIERALLQRARQYSRDITFMSSDAPSVEQGNGGLRELVRSIIREELQKLHGVQQLQASMPLAEAIRREVRQAVGAPETYEAPQRQYGVPQEPYGVPQQQTQVASYAAALRESDRYVAPTLAAAIPQTTLGLRPRAMLTVDEARRPRKSDEWRTPDQRPLCFHCGEVTTELKSLSNGLRRHDSWPGIAFCASRKETRDSIISATELQGTCQETSCGCGRQSAAVDSQKNFSGGILALMK